MAIGIAFVVAVAKAAVVGAMAAAFRAIVVVVAVVN